MPTPQQILRGVVCAAIETARRAGQYEINDFDTRETYFPADRLPEVPEAGTVWIEYQANDDRLLTRGKSFEREIGIRVTFQKRLSGDEKNETAECDRYGELLDQLRDTARGCTTDDSRFAWLRNEGQRDSAGQPISFAVFREANLFLGQFTAHFQTILS